MRRLAQTTLNTVPLLPQRSHSQAAVCPRRGAHNGGTGAQGSHTVWAAGCEQGIPPQHARRMAARVRALPHTTVPHIPASARRPMATIMAQCLEAMLEGKEDAQLEQGRSKLLMSPAPNGFDFRTELATRIRFWQADNLDGLLTRIESQALEMARARQSTPEDEAGRAPEGQTPGPRRG